MDSEAKVTANADAEGSTTAFRVRCSGELRNEEKDRKGHSVCLCVCVCMPVCVCMRREVIGDDERSWKRVARNQKLFHNLSYCYNKIHENPSTYKNWG